jgi:GT2 family glycosyltransferase/glycosyltransferase involved in cell wall biosynthesis
MLNEIGVDLGTDLMEPDEWNEAGYWENNGILKRHERLLQALESARDMNRLTLSLPEGWLQKPEVISIKDEIRDFVGSQIARTERMWGFKDPRTAVLLPMWNEIFEELDVEPVFMLSVRHPSAVSASLRKRNGISYSHSQALWLKTNLDALAFTEGKLRVVVDYDRWFHDGMEQAKSVIAALDPHWEVGIEKLENALQSVVRTDLNHYADQFEPSKPLAECLYSLLAEAAVTGIIPEEIYRMTGAFDDLTELPRLWSEFLRDTERDLAETRSDLQNTRTELEQTEKDLRSRTREVVCLQRLADLRVPLSQPERERAFFPPMPQQQSAQETVIRPLRICIVSPEFVGPHRCGGIGTAYTELGKALARAGHHVVFLYSRGEYCETHSLDYWISHYWQQGIRLEPLPAFQINLSIPHHQSISYRTYCWLNDRDFDIVHFPELEGAAYYSLLAKRQGLGLSRTLLCVGTHGPTAWYRSANEEPPNISCDMELDFMERESTVLADVLWSPSQYLLNWMLEQGWKLAKNTYVQPYIMPTLPGHAVHTEKANPGTVNRFVFFGRLETRKGITLFCDALDRLAREGIEGIEITFLGRHSMVLGQGSAEYISQRSKIWPWPCKVVDNLNQPEALQYLQQEGVMAVIASPVDNSPNTVYECLSLGIRFIACSSGGIPELIDERDLEEVCFPYDAESLAAKFKTVLEKGIPTARPAIDMDENIRAWMCWHEGQGLDLARAERLPALADPAPMVSVCLVSSDRSRYLAQTVASLQAQNYPKFEVVLIDNGSTEPDTLACLNDMEPLFERRGWRMVRQESRCLGAARNVAASHATGEYLLFMQDDNIAKPDEVTVFVKAALMDKGDIITCGCDLFEGEEPSGENEARERWVPLGGALVPSVVKNWFGGASYLVRKDVLPELWGCTEEYIDGCEDWEFFAKAALLGFRIEVVPQALYWQRTNGDGTFGASENYAGRQRIARLYSALMPEPLRHLAPFAQAFARDSERCQRAKDMEIKTITTYYQETIAFRDLITKSRLLKDLGQRWQAIATLQQSLLQARNCSSSKAKMESLAEIGMLLIELGQPDTAVTVLLTAHEAAIKIGDLSTAGQLMILIDRLSGSLSKGSGKGGNVSMQTSTGGVSSSLGCDPKVISSCL